MEMLHCKTADMVNKEIAVHLLAYNLIRANLARAARLNDKTPRHLSFMAAVQLMCNTTSLCITLTGSALGRLISALPSIDGNNANRSWKTKRLNQPRVIK